MADCVYADVARACFYVLADFCCYVGGTAERCVAACGFAEVHRVALAQVLGRDFMRRFDTRAERAEQMDRAAVGRELAPDALDFLADEIHSFRVAFGCDDVWHPAIAMMSGALQRSFGAAADPN